MYMLDWGGGGGGICERFHKMSFESYRASIHHLVSCTCTNVLVYM